MWLAYCHEKQDRIGRAKAASRQRLFDVGRADRKLVLLALSNAEGSEVEGSKISPLPSPTYWALAPDAPLCWGGLLRPKIFPLDPRIFLDVSSLKKDFDRMSKPLKAVQRPFVAVAGSGPDGRRTRG